MGSDSQGIEGNGAALTENLRPTKDMELKTSRMLFLRVHSVSVNTLKALWGVTHKASKEMEQRSQKIYARWRT